MVNERSKANEGHAAVMNPLDDEARAVMPVVDGTGNALAFFALRNTNVHSSVDDGFRAVIARYA